MANTVPRQMPPSILIRMMHFPRSTVFLRLVRMPRDIYANWTAIREARGYQAAHGRPTCCLMDACSCWLMRRRGATRSSGQPPPPARANAVARVGQRPAVCTRTPESIHDNVVQINSDTESHLPECGAVMIAIRLTGKPCDFAPTAGEISYRQGSTYDLTEPG